MPISWNEIRKRAIEFSQEWHDATRENAEAQSFYNDFFNVFGISRRRVATFEEPVKKLGDKRGRIDLFWKGTMLVEQKSAGKNLAQAKAQALDYFPHLKEEELPRYVLVSNFQQFQLHDLQQGTQVAFALKDLHKNVEHFGFIAGYQKREFKDHDPVNIEASELMGQLHDQLKEIGYEGNDLELLLVRLLFCLFADSTGIFEKDIFTQFIEQHTREDGSDLGACLAHLFQTLNKPHAKRAKTLNEDLARFPYINGALFEQPLSIAAFSSQMRAALLRACYFDWSFISPAIFGSLFQSVMDKQKRRGIGAHYTTEQNILKVIRPLFLDALYTKFAKVKHSRNKLLEFHKQLGNLRFFDPACGCGNFLIIAYRELRELEIQVLQTLHKHKQRVLDVSALSRIDVDQFYGIELEEFPARIAEVALWLIDHQMNMKLSEAFGHYYARIPLQKSAHIIHGNALTINWQEILPPSDSCYILGNPPFVGKYLRTQEQGQEMAALFHDIKGSGVLDYVAAWYLKAAQYIQNTHIKCAFVSTNSIAQGEQTAVLWQTLLTRYHIKIHFAHRTFAWTSKARGKAAVHCVIIGFAAHDTLRKLLYDYDMPNSDPHELEVKNINPYLVESPDIVMPTRLKPICSVPVMQFGSKPVDGGHFFLTDEEKAVLLFDEPQAAAYIKPVVSAKEFFRRINRWCLWLNNITPVQLKQMPQVTKRVAAVRQFRQASKKQLTQRAADYPTLFAEIRQPNTDFIAIPLHSSENREYVPMGFFSCEFIVHSSCACVPNATLYHFGVLTSLMHMEWMRHVCGRLKNSYRYSSTLVYNNFSWPQGLTDKHRQVIEAKAQAVLDARAQYPR
ncbi:MAG: DNA methyltransferase, partial [Myxococcota bacterium]